MTGVPSTQTSESTSEAGNGEGVQTEETTAEETQETTTEAEATEEQETEVDTESPAFKSALSAKVEEVVGSRVSRGVEAEKAKTVEAEGRATAAEARLSELEQQIQTLTQERDEAQAAKAQVDKTNLTLKLSIEEGVSVDLINSLKGETEDELRKAIKLVSSSSNGKSVDRIFNGKENNTIQSSADALADRAAARISSRFTNR